MKHLLILGGGSKRNLEWVESCRDFFKNDFNDVYTVEYEHWNTGEKNIDFNLEIERLRSLIAGEPDGEWYIFAKSIGSILALKAVLEKAVSPVKCVFFGIPLNIVADTVFKESWSLLSDFSIPTLAFHNVDDPTADYVFTRDKLDQYNNLINLRALDGNTHDYLNFAEYHEAIREFLV